MTTMALTSLLASYVDGDELGWAKEFSYLRVNHAERLANIWETAQHEGIKAPVMLGYDGRVWDGHHRLCVAHDLGIEDIPVDFASPWDELNGDNS